MIEPRATLPTLFGRRLRATVLTVTLVAAALAAATPATATPSLVQLQGQRLALIRRIAQATDRLALARVDVAVAQRRQVKADQTLDDLRRRYARWAVDAYVDAVDSSDRDKLRRKGWTDVVSATDHAVVLHYRLAKATVDERTAEAQHAADDALRSRTALAEMRRTLERTIADRQEAESENDTALPAPAGPAPVRYGAARFTRFQTDLMARFPFGPVSSFPEGLVPTGQIVDGIASWYGPGFDGRLTASGAIFDQEAYTVASRSLALGTILLISRGERSVLALVNDRGPYVTGRVLDLSKGTARALDTISAGIANVHAEVLVPLGS